jgi:hypothetical protein
MLDLHGHMASRRATGAVLCWAQGSIGGCTMDFYWALLVVVSISWVYLTGRIAQRRGRSFKVWVWISALILGPFAIPLLWLLPNLRGNDGATPEDPTGEQRPARSPSPPAEESNRDFKLRHHPSFGV